MTSLIDRYVYTALRRVPERQRADIDRELRASIDDAVDARVEGGEERDAAVEGTLLELGDPDRLADRYADRADYLIGPSLYPVWRRLMATLLCTVLPIVVAVVVVIQLIDDPAVGKVIGAAVSAALNVGVHLAFWTTLVFVIVERTGAWRGGPGGLRVQWSLKDLPRYEPSGMTKAQLATDLIWPVLLIAGLVLQQFTFTEVPVLDPANWSFWWPFLIVVIALRGAWAIWVYRSATWTRAAAVVNAVLAVLVAGPLVWLLATDRFVNPDYHRLADLRGGDVQRWVSLILAAVIIMTTLYDIFDVARRAERTRRGLPTKVPGSGGNYTYG
jgi:hypothetical protein